ncbi:hypothetical protein DL98DRAFT_454441 [Cadophora sp. DSE1049]|nr:hypothetical protein DL98DRAFT_454441 [Cadophora sp. DSE1049]
MAAKPGALDMDIVSICFGFSLGFFILTSMKAGRQTFAIYRRTHSLLNFYAWMIWTEGLASLIMAILSWFYIRGEIQGSFGFFFALVLISLQTQCLLQIIANRVGLIMVDKRKARALKWTLFGFVGLINISVFVIWIPARMNISHTFAHVNDIWDRIEKVLYLIIDGALNGYFLYLVRAKLISRGLNKYKPLFNFNAVIVGVSLSMDILIIGMMSLPNGFIYVQFHPLAYIVKLNIELSMADLISKVVRSHDRVDDSTSNNNPTELTSTPRKPQFGSKSDAFVGSNKPGQVSHVYASNTRSEGYPDEGEIGIHDQDGGILKTISTVVLMEGNGDGSSVSSSMRHLNESRCV